MVSLQAAVVLMALSATGSGETVLLDFYSDACGPCHTMAPTINRLITKGYPVRKVNVVKDPALAARYGISSIPCFVMLVDGREVDRVGFTSISRLEQMCRLAPPKRTPAVAEAISNALAPRLTAVTSQPPLAREKSAQEPYRGEGATPGWLPRHDPETAAEAKLIAASARLRIADPDGGHSCGSGTVIDSRQGEALILTCGHIFRDSAGKGAVEVDLFCAGGERKLPGRLLSYDLKRDVGLVAIRVSGPVTTARVAPPNNRIAKGAAVTSVGCNNGSSPSSRRTRVVSLDKFVGPPNLQVAGMPVEGRSGGGLFNDQGQVVGVCNAADPEDRAGLYAALASIHTQLDEAGLSHIFRESPSAVVAVSHTEPPSARAPLVAVQPTMPREMPQQMPNNQQWQATPMTSVPWATPQSAAVVSNGLSAREAATLEKVRRRLSEGAEVMCVIRSRTNPRAESEVIVLDQVSPEFFRQLAGESRSRAGNRLTDLAVPSSVRPTKPAPKTVNGWSRSTDGWQQRR